MKAPYFPLFVRDWLCDRSVLKMSGEAVKAYLYLLCESWLQVPRATLPNDEPTLIEMARCSQGIWAIVKNSVMTQFKTGKCKEHKGLLYNPDLLEISRKYEAQQRFKNKNAEKHRLNAEKRQPNAALDNANASDNENAVVTERERRALEALKDYPIPF